MSTKIFSGIRFPLSRLGEFVEEARIKGLRAVERRARELLAAMKDPEPDKDDRKLRGKERETRLRWKKAHALVTAIGEAAQSPVRDFADLSFGWNLFVAPGSRFVLGSPWGSLDREAKALAPRWVEEYGYWDNTDPPEKMRPKEWRRRKIDWEIACAPTCERHSITLYVFDAKTSRYTHDMSWLELRLADHTLKNGKRFGKPDSFRAYARRARKIEKELGIA